MRDIGRKENCVFWVGEEKWGGGSKFSSVQSCPTLCDPVDYVQHTGLPCPSPTPRACSNSCPLSWWCYPTISSSVAPFSSRPQSSLASGSFQKSCSLHQVAKVLELQVQHQSFQWIFRVSINIQDFNWIFNHSFRISFRIDLFDLLKSKGLSRVFSNTTVQKHWFFGAQLSL